ncbi:MAG: aminoacyl-tRNA hydrolase [Actinomycetota bacterium]|nr:aminoacyl-tRNA hydrolase [Actinomycetota bacterium]
MAAGDGLRVNRTVVIPIDELDVRFAASGGPGGQHANRSNTRVDLRFDVVASSALGPRQKERVVERLGPVIRVVVDAERSQTRNRAIANQRLAEKLARALRIPTARVATKPSRAAKARRLDAKRIRGDVKRQRSRPPADD